MKKIFIISILFFLNSFDFGQKTLRMGKHEYYIKKNVSVFLKDDGLNAEYDIYATKDNRKKFGCESLAKRNDSIFRKSYMSFDYKNKIVKCRQLFYYEQSYKVDSIHRYFKQNKDGSFGVLKVYEYRNKKITNEYPKK
ncbi:MAG: hypothetical protein ACRC0E_05635 [Soonwooa sp.]